jgi:hypothetical protein
MPRNFHLQRDEDLTGMSGTGIVADGIEFDDGTVAMRWNTEISSTVVYAEIKDVETVHGHDGRTRVVWDA